MPSLGQGCAHGGLQAQPSPAPRLHVAHQLRMTPTKLLYCMVGVGKSKAYVVAHENDVTFELPPPESFAGLGHRPCRHCRLCRRGSRVIAPSLKPAVSGP